MNAEYRCVHDILLAEVFCGLRRYGLDGVSWKWIEYDMNKKKYQAANMRNKKVISRVVPCILFADVC